MIYWVSYFFLKLLSYFYFPCTYIGTENFPRKGGFIVASNHISNCDPFILGMSKLRRFSYVAKEELFKTKFSSFLFHEIGAFPIKRESADFRAIRETFRRLQKGPVVIFPEGTRRIDQRRKRVEAGVGLIVLKSKVPVIPAYIKGSDKVLPVGAKFPTRNPVQIVFGKPIHFSPNQSYESIANQIMDEIEALKS